MDDVYKSKEARYELFNFHDPDKIEHYGQWLMSQDADFSALLLNGEIGSGRDYFLQSVVYNLQRNHPDRHFDYKSLDLADVESNGNADKLVPFIFQQLSTYADHDDIDIIDDTIRLAPKEKPSSMIEGMTLSAGPFSITANALGDILKSGGEEVFKAPQSEGRLRFHELLGRICQKRKLLLHFHRPELLDVVVLRWLFDDARIIQNLSLAFSINSKDANIKQYCERWHININEIEIKALDPSRLTAVINKRFAPNRFDPDFIDWVHEYSGGNPGRLAIIFKKMVSEDLLLKKDNGWCFKGRSNDRADVLSVAFCEPINAILHECAGNYGPQIEEFLRLLSLCGGIGPVELIFDYLGLDDEQQEQIDDIMETYLIKPKPTWLIDLGYHHPSFKGHLVYRFKHQHSVAFMMQRLGTNEKENRSASLFRHFNQHMTIDSKAKAGLMLRLARLGNLTDTIEQYNLALCWWIDNSNADDLKKIIAIEIKDGDQDPVALWQYIVQNESTLPAIILLALLDAYKEQPGGMPSENLIPFIIRRSTALYHLGHFSEALEDLKDANTVDEGYDPSLNIYIKTLTGVCLKSVGSYPEALPYLKQALESSMKVLGEAHPDTVTSLGYMGSLLRDMGELQDAKPYYEKALDIRMKVLGEAHPDTAASLNNMGSLLLHMGELQDAKPYCEKALDISMKALGEAHPDTAASLNNMGSLLQDMGELQDAKPYYEKALEIRMKVLGEAHPDTATSLNNMGALLQDMGELQDAKPYYEKALEIRMKVLGEAHPQTANSLNHMGALLQHMGQLQDAKPFCEKALEIRMKVLGEAHPQTANSLNHMGALLQHMGQLQDAKPYYEKALEIRMKVLGEAHPQTKMVMEWLSDIEKPLE